jgi:hypothetical protein
MLAVYYTVCFLAGIGGAAICSCADGRSFLEHCNAAGPATCGEPASLSEETDVTASS